MRVQSEHKSVLRGDDHDLDEGRELRWVEDTATPWPALSGTVQLEVDGQTFPAVVVEPTTAPKEVYVELTSLLTTGLSAGSLDYKLRAVQANGHVVTLVTGKLVVR